MRLHGPKSRRSIFCRDLTKRPAGLRQVGTTKNGRDKDSEKDVDNNLQLCALSATGIMYEDVIIICLSPIYGCDKKLEDLIRRLRMLCLLTWFCTNDLQNIEFQNEQPHSYLPLLEEFVT